MIENNLMSRTVPSSESLKVRSKTTAEPVQTIEDIVHSIANILQQLSASIGTTTPTFLAGENLNEEEPQVLVMNQGISHKISENLENQFAKVEEVMYDIG